MSKSIHFQADYKVAAQDLKREDGGQAIIFHEDPIAEQGPGVDGGLHVRIQSWDETKHHPGITALAGKQIRVTIEILD